MLHHGCFIVLFGKRIHLNAESCCTSETLKRRVILADPSLESIVEMCCDVISKIETPVSQSLLEIRINLKRKRDDLNVSGR